MVIRSVFGHFSFAFLNVYITLFSRNYVMNEKLF